MKEESVFPNWEEKTKDILNRLLRDAPQEGLSLALSQYILDRRPFALMKGLPQDLRDQSSRLADLICGVPYVSEKHPWPKYEQSGLWMQPILQLNLATLRKIFGVNWGDDLLQVWARVESDLNKRSLFDSPLLLRVLPRSDLSDPATNEFQDWRIGGDPKSFFYFDDVEFRGKELCNWYYAGQMFGTRQQLLDFAYKRVSDFGDEEFEWLDATMEELSESPLCGENESDFLGGWGGKHGENDASYGDGLVLRISDGDGALVAVHRNMTKTGDPEFLLSYSLR